MLPSSRGGGSGVLGHPLMTPSYPCSPRCPILALTRPLGHARPHLIESQSHSLITQVTASPPRPHSPHSPYLLMFPRPSLIRASRAVGQIQGGERACSRWPVSPGAGLISSTHSRAGRWTPIFASPRVNAEDAKNEKELWAMIFEKVRRHPPPVLLSQYPHHINACLPPPLCP